MARREVAAKRYAQAIFAIARDANTLDRWYTDLETLAGLVAEPTVGEFLRSTKIAEAQKSAILDQALRDLDPNVSRLAKLLVRKRRIGIVDQILAAYNELLNTTRGIAVARVTTAVALTDDGRRAVETAVQRASGATEVQLEERVDREILGGAIIQLGDHIVDGSLRTRLAGLKRSLAGSMA